MPTSSSALTLTAYAGDGALLLGFSLDPSELKTHDLVGFSIQCTPPPESHSFSIIDSILRTPSRPAQPRFKLPGLPLKTHRFKNFTGCISRPMFCREIFITR